MKACPECGQRFMGGEEFCPKDGHTLVELEQSATEDPLVGTVLDGRYRIDKKLGEGGMGVVYLATHATIGKRFAVKVLRGELSQEQEVAERFTQEARAAAAIGNEHIIDITDFGRLPDGAAYFVMEFLDGDALHDLLAGNQRLEIERALHLLVQCCDGLSAAHNADIVHRDLKPDNIFLVQRGQDPNFIKILDFGIAKVARESGRLTRTGMIFGTPQYMSPEQAAGTEMDARTDVYSLGIIMYEMICGHVPFEADTFMGVLTKHLYEEPIPPRQLIPPVDVPQNVEAVLLKAMAKKPEKRYQSMEEFAQDLRSLGQGKTPAVVFDQMRASTDSTVPPVSPTAVVTGERTPYPHATQPALGKKRWPLFAGIGGVVVLVGIVLAVLFGGNGKKQDANAGVQLQPSAQNPPAAEIEPVAKAPAVVKILGEPTGASLYKEDTLMGPLPLEVPKPGLGEPAARYQVRKDGYKNLEVVVAASSPVEFKIALEKLPEPKPAAKVQPKKKSKPKASTRRRSSRRRSRPKREAPVDTKPKPKRRASDLADPWGN